MSFITYPLNNIDYTAEDAELFHCTRTSGIWAENSFPISVTGVDNNVTIGKGIAWINNEEFSGKVAALKSAEVLDLGIADNAYPRIDVIAIQFNVNNNATDIIVKKGTPATNPVRPAIVRTGAVYELYLASVYRPAGATAITASNITDLRLDKTVCGLMADSVTKVDMEAIREQFMGLVAELEEAIQNIEVGEVVPIEKGGTDATERIGALNNLISLPSNTEPVADTPKEWAKLGSFVCYYSSGTEVINKPSTYGTLVQIVAPSTNGAIEATTIQQFWIRQAYGFVYNRSGNNTGWDASAEVNGADAWKRNFGMFPISSVYTTATYTNPGNFLGGTWECIDKQLAYYGFNESKASISGGVVGPVIFHEINTEGSLMGGEDGANIDDYSLYGVVEGHSFTFRLILKISDDTLNTGGLLGKLNFKGLGFSDLPYTIRPIMAYSADGNAMFVCSLEYDTGNIRLLKTIPLGDSNTIPQGSSIAIYTTIPVSKAAMYNAYCDKFIWKRTS